MSQARGRVAGPSAALLAVVCLAGPVAGADAQAVIVSPLPGTPTALPQTQISFLGAPIANLKHVLVVGSSTGRHSGQLHAYAGLTGASFIPAKPFRNGERVTVSARLGDATVRTDFTVARVARVALKGFPRARRKPGDVQSFLSRPDLKPAVFRVNRSATAGAAPGDIFTTPGIGAGMHAPVILDGSGALVWSHPEPAGVEATDLRVQSYQGKPVLTWWEGKFSIPGFGQGQGVVLGTDYRPVANVVAGNGLKADLHEFRITPQGTALISSYSAVRTDLSPVKGPRRGVAFDGVVQEVDIATGLVVWEWHSLSTVAPSASYLPVVKSSKAPYDYFHVNSVFAESSGNVLVSARNTWGVYLISRRTGRLIWRLGGKQSTFKLGAGVLFAYQHDAQRLADGAISLFDDQGGPPVKPPSTAKIIKLSLAKKTATLVRRFVHTPPLLTFSQGNLQGLTNGNSFVGWGGIPNITEFDSSGKIVFDGRFPKGADSYRAFRQQWDGQPVDSPSLSVVPNPHGNTITYMSWNGATQVASWRLLAGPSVTSLAPTTTVPRTGFETAIPLPAGASAAQAEALGSAGQVLGRSRVIG